MVYALIKFLLGWKVVANILYWVCLILAPFSILDCFRKIAFGAFDEDNGELVNQLNRALIIISFV